MSGEEPHLSPLELRKRMLIAESELNRAQLLKEWESMTAPVRGFAERARSFGSMASSAASLVAGLATFWRCQPMPAPAKPSRVETVLRGVRLAASIALTLRARGDKEEPK